VDVGFTPDSFNKFKTSKFARIDRTVIETRRLVRVGMQIGESQLTMRALGGQNPQIVFQEVSNGNLGYEISINTNDLLSAKIMHTRIVKTS